MTFVPISGTLPLIRTRPSSMSLSAARLEQNPISLRYLLMRIAEEESMEVVYSRKITLSFGYDTRNGKVVSLEGGMPYGFAAWRSGGIFTTKLDLKN